MFDIGIGEFIIISIVSMLCYDPKEIPLILRKIGKYYRSILKLRKTIVESINDNKTVEEYKYIKGEDGKFYKAYATDNGTLEENNTIANCTNTIPK